MPGFKHVRIPELTVTDKAIIAAHLAAFGSDNVRKLYQTWRSTIAAIGTEIVVVKSVTGEYPDRPDHDQVRHYGRSCTPAKSVRVRRWPMPSLRKWATGSRAQVITRQVLHLRCVLSPDCRLDQHAGPYLPAPAADEHPTATRT